MKARAGLVGLALGAMAAACSSSGESPPISTGRGGLDASVADSGRVDARAADAAEDALSNDGGPDAGLDGVAEGGVDATADATEGAAPPACRLGNSGTGEGAACDTCATAACCDAWNVCYADPLCVNLSNCIANCGRGAITPVDAGAGVDAGTCRGNCMASTHATNSEMDAFDAAATCVANACGPAATAACP